MALRGTAARRSADGPLTGVLRDLDRSARRIPARRAPDTPPIEPAPGPRGRPGPPGARGGPPLAAVLTTGPDGRASWTLPPGELTAAPVVGAVAGGTGPLLVVVEEATVETVTVRVWALAPRRAPAGAGMPVHITLTPVHGG